MEYCKSLRISSFECTTLNLWVCVNWYPHSRLRQSPLRRGAKDAPARFFDTACFTFVRALLRRAQPPQNQRINLAARKYRCVYTSVYVENPERVKIRKFGICWNLYMLYIIRILKTSGFWNWSHGGTKPTRSKVVTWKIELQECIDCVSGLHSMDLTYYLHMVC
jgi:hypothetical protein